MKLLALILFFILSVAPANADNQISNFPILDQDYMEPVLGIDYSCGVRAWTELVEFYVRKGYGRLSPVFGDPNYTVPDNSDYLRDLYSVGVTHSGYNGSNTQPLALRDALRAQFASNRYDADIVLDTTPTWTEVAAELDAGRPVLFCTTTHWLSMFGFTSNPRTVTVSYGHAPFIRTYTQAQIAAMGIRGAIYVRPVALQDPVPNISMQPFWPQLQQWLSENNLMLTLERLP